MGDFGHIGIGMIPIFFMQYLCIGIIQIYWFGMGDIGLNILLTDTSVSVELDCTPCCRKKQGVRWLILLHGNRGVCQLFFLSMIRRVSESYNIDLNSPEMNNNSCKKQNISLDVRFPSSLLMSLLEI